MFYYIFQDLGIACGKATIGRWQEDPESGLFPIYMDDAHSAVLTVGQDASIKLTKHFPEVR